VPATRRHLLPAALLPAILLAFAAGGGGCAGPNPSFPLTAGKAADELADMTAHPKPLPRPVVVIDGYLGLGIGPAVVAGQLRPVAVNGDAVITVALTWCADFEDARRTIIAAVDKAFPTDDPHWTREVDVVGISMGGLAARYAAADPSAPGPFRPRPAGPPTAGGHETVAAVHLSADGGVTAPAATPPPSASRQPARRLRIARLFTLATPHRGATAAVLPAPLSLQTDMRPGSAFLAKLDALRAADDGRGTGYPIVAYTRVPDGVVGAANTAPTGGQTIWMPAGFLDAGHLGIPFDRRIVADLARRLRGEPSYAVEPLAPVPE
jgi:hypothetical protein